MTVATQALFQERVQQKFQAQIDENTSVELTLTTVTPNDVTSSAKYECFSLLFDGPSDPPLEQAMYTLENNGDQIPIFLVPLAKDDQGFQYEAVFNRSRDDAG